MSSAHTLVRLLNEAAVASSSNQGTAVMQIFLNRLGGIGLIVVVSFYLSTFGQAAFNFATLRA